MLTLLPYRGANVVVLSTEQLMAFVNLESSGLGYIQVGLG